MPVTRMTMSSREPDVALAVIRGLQPGFDFNRDRDDGPFSFAADGVSDERLSLQRLDLICTAHGEADPMTSYTVCQTTTPLRILVGRRQLDTSRPFLYPRAPIRSSWEHEARSSAVQLDIDAVDALARQYFGRPGLRVRFTGGAPIDAERERHWRAVAGHALGPGAERGVFDDPLLRDTLFRMAAAALLSDFPNSTLDLPPAHDGGVAVPATIRRAIAYMEEHIAEPIGLLDVAEASRLSPRGLQDAFHRIVGVSPMQYLRSLRLSAAHADLLAADIVHQDTVTAIAHRWGFSHVPRFAAAYRTQYGEYPRDTLAR
ncbi:helix-turn-helix transcriptional regulator [Leifsonia shinshuensis]|uniref:Helix-turn-helix transcriptional regulator n=1 Tax=Leifsonia shinshuensis TaxID=150026 RepID=A0A7G6YEN9_9MICO|nr:AraC family transcriptional regulator [Leifsonia shinshuensis]QNE36954.1 helix-turn-helix transcriptional regulator [Leifsonia shinshuensis]